ncbi:2-methoxy-6-polyprenyl-1,4-benzoquinol methylase, mitochondrial-like [Amphibalanus amphitrite]|uniref:2-methoxy-6-polyprenyl-1,4-benzoquinol methylase, mitochondrial-like n=1 Tax=Amphibalanus amphitrite TaxID=1232801 RepID=UPI001C91E695|nr:2-methoxy-6-polyprenyl-1,4-benzoquinol methylase, mitochondrial-like [Amphibalanus amphitrite]XP_043224477.1 2-methoxy-6-polyprenyl-1,4-benzoquinol methylase, mitochondrial-like [Amphibalanus amphitrite]XP_043224487.1 2-methoxy-6-polyprenyl-1,4-benzoquinol methylase, mitochondrial-like [Amphibalanus amphitrite]XP_043224497.1 2-methoxy-6-polyprenyl-1,4-benzoquinol methylase, mitochondrial-like [Amphibalanus amphitrite]XP_043224503.1 2-methoxy-6-polyprenyl-1,4-benzoquinol methylase, mitochondr
MQCSFRVVKSSWMAVWLQRQLTLAHAKRCCSQNASSTHFGYSTVKEEEKAGKVHEVFSSVAAKYDLMNDAMSFGTHRLWKDTLMRRLRPSHRTKLLDVAGGTGDVAFRYLTHADLSAGEAGEVGGVEPAAVDVDLEAEAARLGVAPIELDEPVDVTPPSDPTVVVCDINADMLEEGRRRAREAGIEHRLRWVEGDAERLPFEDGEFDAYTIAFGIRNVTHIDRALAEAYRVLRPGGRFLCLEFSHVPNPLIRWAYDQYSFQVIPPMGTVLAGDWKSYQYLVESIRRFPAQEEFAQMIRSAGFGHVTYENLTFGVVAIHSGFKMPNWSAKR